MRFLILGGTEKSGTTAMFNYFYGHPEVVPSMNKETDFFRKNSCDLDLVGYKAEFLKKKGNLYVEASPGYLAESLNVIPRIRDVIPSEDLRLVFILRDPVDRIYSSYSFHKSRGYIEKDVDFAAYIDACIDYEACGALADGINEWSLRSLAHGKYSSHIEGYMNTFGSNVLIVDYDNFKRRPSCVMTTVCAFAGIADSYFDGFTFFEANKTFEPKWKSLHLLLLKINNLISPILYKIPKIKQKLMGVYHVFNGEPRQGLSARNELRLREYYAQSVNELVRVLPRGVCPAWVGRYS